MFNINIKVTNHVFEKYKYAGLVNIMTISINDTTKSTDTCITQNNKIKIHVLSYVRPNKLTLGYVRVVLDDNMTFLHLGINCLDPYKVLEGCFFIF